MEKKRLDLNLLRVLSVLLKTQKASEAARILGVSQPAVSRALNKLREYFNDDLFIRTRYGLMPTEKANEINKYLPKLLDEIEQSIQEELPFDPNNSTFTIAIDGFSGNILAQEILQEVLDSAVNANIYFLSWTNDTTNKIINGSIDVGISFYPIDSSKELRQKKLLDDEFVLVVRKDHPVIQESIDLISLTNWPLSTMLVSNWNEYNSIANNIIKSGVALDIRIRSATLNPILYSLLHHDYMFPCPKRLAISLGKSYRIIRIEDNNFLKSAPLGVFYADKNRESKKIKFILNIISRII